MERYDIDIDRMEIRTDWPIIARLKDDQYPYEGYDHLRYTARGIIKNAEGLYGFLHICGEDYFGKRDHLETCGGGLEENEDLSKAMIREAGEEMGITITKPLVIGSILDTYNLIGRITLSTFFFCEADKESRVPMQRTEEEQILIKQILWLDREEALKRLENGKSKVDILVQRRDLAAFRYYLEHRQELEAKILQ